MRSTILIVLLVAPLLPGCAGGPARAGAGSSPNLIGPEELRELQDLNTIEAIRRLRPGWLRRRSLPGPVAAQAGVDMYPIVHIDGIRQAEIEVLTSLPAREVGEIEYLPGREATTRFGTGYSNGAILVRTRR